MSISCLANSRRTDASSVSVHSSYARSRLPHDEARSNGRSGSFITVGPSGSRMLITSGEDRSPRTTPTWPFHIAHSSRCRMYARCPSVVASQS